MPKLSKKQALAYRMELTAWFGLAIFLLGLVAQLFIFISAWATYVRLPLVAYEHISSFWSGWALSLLAVIVPPLVAFYAGDRLAKPRSKYEPLYNGVLFAFLAIWLSAVCGTLFYSFVSVPVSLSAVFEYLQCVPQLVALSIVLLLAYAYGKKFKHIELHNFKPFQFLLIGSMSLLFVAGIFTLTTSIIGQAFELVALALIGTLIGVGMVAIPYIFSSEKHSLNRLTHAFVAGSIGVWSLAAMGSLLMSVPNLESLQMIVTSVTGLAAWVVYIYLLHRHQA